MKKLLDYSSKLLGLERDSEGKAELSLDDLLLKKIGFGKAQIKAIGALSIIWMADGAELIILGFLQPLTKKEWGLSDRQIHFISTAIFFGILAGALTVGKFSDSVGRRKPALISSAGVFFSSVLSAYSQNYTQLLLFRALFGFFMGFGSPLMVGYISEVTPSDMRGKTFAVAGIGFVAGELFGLALAYLLLGSFTEGNWRYLILSAAIPGFFAFPMNYMYFKESPRYLLVVQNRKKKAIDILEEMNLENNIAPGLQITKQNKNEIKKAFQIDIESKKQLERWADRLHSQQSSQKAKYSELFSSRNRRTTILLSIAWFSFSILYYGTVILMPQIIVKERERQFNQDNNQLNEQNGQQINKSHVDFIGMIISVLAELPSITLMYFIVDKEAIGKRTIIIGCLFIMSGLSFFAFILGELNTIFYMYNAAIRFFCSLFSLSLYPFTAEIFQTSLRLTGLGFTNSISRLGGMLLSWIGALGFMFFGNFGPLLIFSFFALFSAIGTYLVPIDTTNKPLDLYHELQQLS